MQDKVIKHEFFKVNSRTLTFLSSFKFLFQVIKVAEINENRMPLLQYHGK